MVIFVTYQYIYKPSPLVKVSWLLVFHELKIHGLGCTINLVSFFFLHTGHLNTFFFFFLESLTTFRLYEICVHSKIMSMCILPKLGFFLGLQQVETVSKFDHFPCKTSTILILIWRNFLVLPINSGQDSEWYYQIWM